MYYYLNTLFILIAKYSLFVSIIIGGIYFIKQNKQIKKQIIIFGFISMISIGVIALILGHLYYNPRPFVVGNFTPLISHSVDNGFPSDHVLLASAIASILYFFSKKTGLYLWIITILLAVSRVYVGVHHPIDVVASMTISIFSTYFIYKILKMKK